MKLSSAVVVLSLTGTASAYSVSRSSIRNLGQKSVQATGPARSNGSTMKMEGTSLFGLMGALGVVCVRGSSVSHTYFSISSVIIKGIARTIVINKNGCCGLIRCLWERVDELLAFVFPFRRTELKNGRIDLKLCVCELWNQRNSFKLNSVNTFLLSFFTMFH